MSGAGKDGRSSSYEQRRCLHEFSEDKDVSEPRIRLIEQGEF